MIHSAVLNAASIHRSKIVKCGVVQKSLPAPCANAKTVLLHRLTHRPRMVSPSASPTPASPHSSPPAGTIAAWRVMLRIAGALLALAVFAYWAAAGGNRGWTKDQVAITKTDDVTGIEYVEYQKHFLPGVEFLTLGVGAGLALIGVTFFFRKKTKSNS